MSNYWRVLSPLHATVTGREKKAEGGRIGLKNGGSSMQEHYLEHGYGPHKKHKKRKSKFGGGRIGLKEGTDKKWIQKATASIKKRGTEGKCTPITKKGCTGRAKALAKTFKKIAKKRKAA
jgi:hypothetical protein